MQIEEPWNLFEEYIHPQTNQLIVVVELKRLFQGSMTLKDFHTKALHLVKQAGYERAAKERVQRDTIISGISSDKIRAKIVKEGKDATLAHVMEVARLENSTQNHLDRMQETAKVNYIQYGKFTRNKKAKGKHSTQSTASGGTEAMEQCLNQVEKARTFHCHQTLVTVGKADTRKARIAKLWMQCVEVVTEKDTLRKSVSKLNIPQIH